MIAQVIVAARCIHFRSMFGSRMREALQVCAWFAVRHVYTWFASVTQLQHEITIEDATATAFSRMLEFLYRWRQHFATVFPFVCDAAQR